MAELILTVIEIVYAFGILVIICELCQRISQSFDEYSDMIDQFDWYLLPMEIQRMLPMIFMFTQQPIEIKYFGTMAYGRPTMKYVRIIAKR